MGRAGPDNWAELSPRIGGPTSAQNGWAISTQNIFFFSFLGRAGPSPETWAGQHWPGPYAMLIICRTWTMVHVLHATEMAAENGGWRRSGSHEAGVSAVIKRLSWWFWRRFCEERWPESSTGRRWRLLQKWERGRNSGCFRRGGGRLVVGIATCGGASGGEACGGPGWWLEPRRERGREKLHKWGQRGCFSADFGPDFLLPQAMKCNPIYRRWKRAILSSGGKTFQPLIWLEESKPSVQSVYLELPNLTVQGCPRWPL